MTLDQALPTPTAMALFMRDMGKYPLLTKDQEELLAYVIVHHKTELVLALAKTRYFQTFVRAVCDQCDLQASAYQRLLATKMSADGGKKLITDILKTLTAFHEGSLHEIELDAAIAPIQFNWPLMLEAGLIRELVDMRTAHARGIDLFDGITIDEVNHIIQLYEQTLEEIKRFERHNIRLVVSVAKGTARGQLMEDRVQWGYLGLRKAIWRFDPTTGNKFSTYGTWWVKQSIMRENMNTAHFIRLPIHLQTRLRELRSARDTQHEALYDDVVDDDAVEMSGEDVEQLHELERLESILSLEAPLNNNPDSGTLMDVYDPEAEDPLTEREQTDVYTKALAQMHRLLPPREVDIVIARYIDERTLDDIGTQMNLSRERIRQLEVHALKILRKSTSFRELFGLD